VAPCASGKINEGVLLELGGGQEEVLACLLRGTGEARGREDCRFLSSKRSETSTCRGGEVGA
jgi:hypothetical protein